MLRVHLGGRRYSWFDTLEAASAFCNEVAAKSNTILCIEDRQPSRWERLRILDSQMKMAQATANQPAFLKALAEYRELKGQSR